ncbi:MAG: 50S ribosomal protein L24 [Acidimicrobiales bacterium]
MKIHKGDEVQVLSGKHRGKTGEVIRALPEQRKVVVSGVNISKRHQRPTRAAMQAGIIDKDMPLPVAVVALICSKDGPTRVRYEIGKDGTKTRVCAKCGGKL